MDGMKSKFNKPRYRRIINARLKNRLNNEVIVGDIINEEEIEGSSFFVVRTSKGNVVKLTKDAYSIQRT